MKKTYRMKDLDCANCAAKMERAIGKLDGVSAVSVNFMTQKLTLEADEERFEAIVEEAGRICRRIEPHCLILGR
ncbi:MAG TPA: heavy-metal-associated domain-containing protein [Candidatus Egerieenecus merdigallinarum]|nr:heavy-metal-associated domain-containing protein [Candidatus Egerieenecus merdigallinarum]